MISHPATSDTPAPTVPDPGDCVASEEASCDVGNMVNTSISSSVNTVIAAAASAHDNTEEESDARHGWTNTFDSNITESSVEEPKYAKVLKRNSKIESHPPTPKIHRKDHSDDSRFSEIQ